MKRFRYGLLIGLFLCSVNQGKGQTSVCQQTTVQSCGRIYVDILYEQAKDDNTLELHLLNRFYSFNLYRGKSEIATKGPEGHFKFEIEVDAACGYWQLFLRSNSGGDKEYLSSRFFWEKGDSIHLDLTTSLKPAGNGFFSSCIFSGRGADKYTLRNVLEYERDGEIRTGLNPANSTFLRDFHNRRLKVLIQSKEKLSELSYNVLKADLIFNTAIPQLVRFEQGIKTRNEQFSAGFNLSDLAAISPSGIGESFYALKYLNERFRFDSKIVNGKIDENWIFNQIMNIANTQLRDRMATYFFCQYQKQRNTDSLIAVATKVVGDHESKRELEFLMTTSQKNISNFQLKTLSGTSKSLGDFKEKLIVLDFWIDGCGPCRSLFSNVISKAEQHYRDNCHIAFISINSDTKIERAMKGIESGLYNSEHSINLLAPGGYENSFSQYLNIIKYPTVVIADRLGNVLLYDNFDLYDFPTFIQSIDALLDKTE